jgi:hypothetical protein
MALNFDTTNWALVVRAHATTTGVRQVAHLELCEAYQEAGENATD